MDKMSFIKSIILLFCFNIVKAEDLRIFPKNFSFGTGSSAYQIEGAWNEDGKSENIWDHWIHTDPTRIRNNDTADVACDSYRNTIDDMVYLSLTNVQHYRFSIPWTRILPSGFADEINMKAIMHYQEQIEILQYLNITPIVTLYYHDLPQSLQDIGGWTNPAMVKYFVDYARICFQYFKVEHWITFSDPRATCRRGYGEGTFAPGIKLDGVGEYLCAYTVLKAHAAAYHLYKESFQDLHGKISIAIDMKWYEPASDNANDKAAAERSIAFEFGLYANPIYKGGWPKEVIDRIDYRSKNENFTKSRLPKFTDEEIDFINGTSDFMAINLYYANVVVDAEEAEFGAPGYMKDMKANVYLNSSWALGVNGQPIVPWIARKALVWLSSSFDDSEILITENGIADNYPYNDATRVSYLRDYLNAILDAIIEDGVKVIGYTAWSLFDSFEWTDGYRHKFGLYYTYFQTDSTRKLGKSSLKFYQKVAKDFIIPQDTTTTTSIPQTTPGSATNIAIYPSLILIAIFLYEILI